MTGSERVMVFGAGGFVGTRICALLAERGIEYRGMTRRTGDPHRRFDLATGHCYALDAQLGMYKPTVIINAAAATHGDTLTLTRGNVVAVEALLSSMHRTANNARLVHIGSAAEYGGAPRGTSQDEQAELRPGAAYGFTKLAGSELVLRAQRNGADAVVLRSFNITGPGSPPSTLLGRVIRQLGTTDTLHMGSLEAWRDYVDVRDVAEAVVAVATAPDQLPPVLNVGSGRATLARDVVQRLVELSGTDTKVVEGTVHAGHAGSPADSVPWQQADTSLIEKHLGWKSTIDLDQSLHDTWSARPAVERAV
ncbi:nucleoside-diphosphate-sugar epimerase [Kribbella amoyensis]|uniref:Nucleoside-diphosphate-sugar epimerase n=1 Tax=Kribbella amoyensis TaxID=996641 RepID=A0A561BP12_9ACTN|nr:NAD(P)-dependent oxidoreductase [Kribbella amoyensis]TWD80616.1 nucleoside-diphosphate-sugar epimerase [Kribbella amoyensis]